MDDWKQRAALVQSYRELAGITDAAVAIGPAPARQAGMSEAFAASVRALELPDDAALLKAMGRGELEAQVREYERAEALAPPDVSTQIDLADDERKYLAGQAEMYRDAGDAIAAGSATATAQAMGRYADRLRVTEAARREWAEATAAKAEAADQARAELARRGPARWHEAGLTPVPAELREAEAVDSVGAGLRHEAQPEADVREPQAGDSPHVDPERWAELKAAQTARVEAGKAARREAATRAVPVTDTEIARYGGELDRIDPEALAAMSSIEGNLAAAREGADRLAQKRARDSAEVEQAGIDEPVAHADAQAGLEAAVTAGRADAEADYCAELEM